MKKLKKLMALVLALMLIVAMLAGCGSGSDSADADEPETEATEAPANTSSDTETPAEASGEEESQWQYGDFDLPICDEPVTLTEIKFLTSDEIAGGGPVDTTGFQTMTDMLGVDIDFILSDSANKAETIALYIVGGDYPDIWTGLNGYYGMSLEGAYEDELILDFTDYLDTCLPNYKYILSTNDYYALNAVTEDGKYVQFNQYQNYEETSMGLAVRQDWLDNLGLDVPVTFDDFHDVIEAFKTEYDATFVLGADGVCGNNFLCAGYGIAGLATVDFSGVTYPVYQVDGQVMYGPVQDGYREYLEMMSQWYSEGLINENFMSLNVMTDSQELVLNEETGLLPLMSTMVTNYPTLSDNPDMELTAIADAVKEPGTINHIGANTDLYFGEAFAISPTCENVEVALKFLDFGYTPQGILLANWGPEGVCYELDENGEPYFADYIIDYAAETLQEVGSAVYEFNFNGKGGLSMRDCRISDVQLSDEMKEAVIGVWNASSDNAWNWSNAAVMTADEQSEFLKIYGDIGTYVAEYTLGVIVGNKTLDDWDNYVATIEGMNLSRCIELWQSAWDRYVGKAEAMGLEI
jgi:putative aldouronate transport system substrate-binding protein